MARFVIRQNIITAFYHAWGSQGPHVWIIKNQTQLLVLCHHEVWDCNAMKILFQKVNKYVIVVENRINITSCGIFSTIQIMVWDFWKLRIHIILCFFSLQVSCKVSQFIYLYLMGCNYFWMLCEGIYLHTLIVVAVFAEKQHLMWYYLLGWGMWCSPCVFPGHCSLFLLQTSIPLPLWAVALSEGGTPQFFVYSVLTSLEILM